MIVNSEIEKAVAEGQAVLMAERLKRKRQVGLANFVRDLTTKL